MYRMTVKARQPDLSHIAVKHCTGYIQLTISSVESGWVRLETS